jgi:hypothetical protein
MEASERPQLPLDHGIDGTVRVLDHRLVVESLTIDDARAAKLVRERAEAGHPAAQTVRDAVEIGVRVLEREGTAAEVDYVRAEFERQAGELRERLGRALAEGDEMLAERITLSFDGTREGSVQKQIDELVTAALDEQREALLKLFSAQEGSNPLFDFKDAMVKVYRELGNRQQAEGEENRKVIAELRRELLELKERSDADSRVAEEAERGTAKGRGFEERVHLALQRIASARGDCASHTGGEQAEGGGRKGDTLIELGATDGPSTGRIVFEAKDKRLSMNEAWGELNESMAGRAASFAVLVVAGEERMPARTHALHEYEGNKMIVAVDREQPDGIALEVAYRLAAARVAMARGRELEVDAAEVRDTAAEALSLLRHAQAIRSTLTGIKTSSDRARTGLDEMVESIRGRLERIESLIASADPDC